jgi:eukaryotic-like serine/threonine-protein kinase
MTLSPTELMVLRACRDLPEDQFGNVHDDEIARATLLSAEHVRIALGSLARIEYLNRVELTTGRWAVQITEKGRLELIERGIVPEKISSYRIQSQPTTIVPKGLGSYDEEDASFFLELLPGRQENDGLRFWRELILTDNLDRRLRVGVISGPPGCGKTSFAKAGLIPLLRDHRTIIYVNCFLDKLEGRLLRSFSNATKIPVASNQKLAKILTSIQKKNNQETQPKALVLFIDQFEQLFLTRDNTGFESQLEQIVKSCDGIKLQSLIIVGDEFAGLTFDILKDLGIDFLPNHHARRIAPFTKPYAKKILMAFGQAMSLVLEEKDSEQLSFVNKAIDGSTQDDGMVIPIRLAMLAESLKGMEWTAKSLEQIGGTQGVVLKFLDLMFYYVGTQDAH